MEHAKIIDGAYQDCFGGTDGIIREDGSVNWRVAAHADPGVTVCPTCDTYYWNEARVLQCKCGTIWDTTTGQQQPTEQEK